MASPCECYVNNALMIRTKNNVPVISNNLSCSITPERGQTLIADGCMLV